MKKIDSPDYATDESVVPPLPPYEGGTGRNTTSFFSQLTRRITFLLFALVFLMGGAAFYFYRQLAALESNPQIQAQREAASLVAQISKIFLLPTNETPTIATVLDPAGLKDQPFFANAHKNDKVLIYANAKEAILYDPVANKIINVAPLVTSNSQTNGALIPSSSSSVNVAPASGASGNSGSANISK